MQRSHYRFHATLCLHGLMRKTTLVLNSIVVVFFVLFLAYTVIARQHLEALARDFVTEKTVAYSSPIVEVASESLESPLVKKLLSDDQWQQFNQRSRTIGTIRWHMSPM
jgi:hypothetical protein